MAVSDGDTITVVKDMGLVANAFDERTLAPLQGHLAIGHVRYSTTGASTWGNAQPIYRSVGDAGFALGHNGNLVNTDRAGRRRRASSPARVGSDSDLVAELLQQADAAPPAGRAQRRPRPRAGPDRGAAQAEGRVLPRADGRRPRHRRARPQRVPPPVPGPARQRLGPGLGDARPRHRRRPLRPRAGAGRDGGHRRHRRPVAAPVPARAHRPQAVPLRVRLLRPPRQPASTARRCTRARQRMGELLAEQAPLPPDDHGPGPGGDGHAGARVGHPRGRGLRPPQRHPVRPRPGQEPLHRAARSSPPARTSGPRACA